DDRSDVRIGDDRGESFELAELGEDVAGERHVRFRVLLLHDLADALLVRGVQEAVEEADGDRFHALLAEMAYSGPDVVFVEGPFYAPVVADTLVYLDAQVAGSEGRRFVRLRVIHVGSASSLQLEE